VFQVLASNAYKVTAIEYGSAVWANLNASSSSGIQSFKDNSWMETYNTEYLSGYGDLVLALDRFAFETSQNFGAISASDYLPTSIDVGNQSVISNITDASLPWMDYRTFLQLTSRPDRSYNTSWPNDVRIAQAFATVVDRKSRIELSLDFMITVIVFNALKLLIMLWILFTDKSEYLVTLGDAAASFLQRPDPCTTGQCMLDKEAHLYRLGHQADLEPETSMWMAMQDRLAGIWQPKKMRYSVSLPVDRQNIFVIL
jgi:hypothetical protein